MLLWPLVAGGAIGGGSNPGGGATHEPREAVVIDVCGADEFAAGHVTGAQHPLPELETRLPGAVKNKALPVILVCASGMRSNRAVAIAKLGYEKATASLEGGMKTWRAANLPVEGLRRAAWPMSRSTAATALLPPRQGAAARARRQRLGEICVDGKPDLRAAMAGIVGRTSVPQIFIDSPACRRLRRPAMRSTRGGLQPLLDA